MNRQLNDLAKFWSKLRRQVARRGGISYTELGALDIFEFFVTLVNYEDEMDAEIKASKK